MADELESAAPQPRRERMTAAALDAVEYKEIANCAPVMVWRSTLEKGFDWCNQSWLDFVGRELEEEVRFGRSVAVHPDDRERCEAAYLDAFQARRRFTSEYRLRRHDGEHRWVLDNAAPFEREGRFAGYLGSCVDITEQRELQSYQRTLLAELNHRVKNNLQLIIAFLSIELSRNKNDQVKTVLKEAVSRVHGIGAIQEQLHQTSSPVINLAEYLPALARSMARLKAGDAVTVSIEAEAIHCSHQQASNLGLIVNELVTNAIKHGAGPEGCQVRVCIRRLDQGEVEILIRDSGPGFAEGQLSTPDSPMGRRLSLLEALARKSCAVLRRENDSGALVRLRFPLHVQA